MTKIYEVDQVGGTTGAMDTHVELFDNGVSLGKVPVDNQGGWTKAASNLALGPHIYTAKAANGMPASEPWEIQVQSDGENFDAVPDTIISPGQKINLPTMTITFSAGRGTIGIMPFNYGYAYSHFPALPGRREGQALQMNVSRVGDSQTVTLDLNGVYSKVSFWHSYIETRTSATFYNADGSGLGKVLLTYSLDVPRQITFSGSNITKIVFVTSVNDGTLLDYFKFE